MSPQVIAAVVGQVSLIRTSLAGDLDCSGATLRGAPGRGSLVCDRAKLGAVFLRPLDLWRRLPLFTAGRDVSFNGAEINGDMDCSCAVFGGLLRLPGTHVTGTVACERTWFDASNGAGLHAPRAQVDGSLVWHPDKRARGARVDLANARAGTLDVGGARWKEIRHVSLNGFTCGSIGSVPSGDAARRGWLDRWLELLRRSDRPSSTASAPIVPQPYEQLVATLRSGGHELEARRVSYERQEARRQSLRGGPRLANWTLGATIGHGFYPRRVLYCALALFVTGTAVFLWARHAGALVPLRKSYPPPLSWAPVYSLDALLPIVDLGQEKRWRPAPDGSAATVLTQAYLVVHILGGWLLATLGVAALTGLLRRDR